MATSGIIRDGPPAAVLFLRFGPLSPPEAGRFFWNAYPPSELSGRTVTVLPVSVYPRTARFPGGPFLLPEPISLTLIIRPDRPLAGSSEVPSNLTR